MIGNGATRPRICFPMWVYQGLPCRRTKPKTMWSCMWNTLPNLTSISARDANPIGAFGLVVPGFTNTYHTPDLARTHGHATFTNLRLRGDR